jgi:hypothetical protein
VSKSKASQVMTYEIGGFCGDCGKKVVAVFVVTHRYNVLGELLRHPPQCDDCMLVSKSPSKPSWVHWKDAENASYNP